MEKERHGETKTFLNVHVWASGRMNYRTLRTFSEDRRVK